MRTLLESVMHSVSEGKIAGNIRNVKAMKAKGMTKDQALAAAKKMNIPASVVNDLYEDVELEEAVGISDFKGVPDDVLQTAQRKVAKMIRQSGKDSIATDTAKMIDKEINKMGWTMTVGGKYVKEDLDEDFTNFSSYAGMYSDGARAHFTDKQGKKRKISASGDNPRKFYIDGKEVSRKEAQSIVGNQKLKPMQGMNEEVEFIDLEEAVAMLEGKSSSGYETYHNDFSSAMKHAYEFAKKKYGITIDPEEIDRKVAMGPKKPSSGKTNSYRLEGDKGAIQVQVYNMDNKKYELNMYKE